MNLHFASSRGCLETVQLLARACGPPLVHLPMHCGLTCLHCASHAGHADVVCFLVKKGGEARSCWCAPTSVA